MAHGERHGERHGRTVPSFEDTRGDPLVWQFGSNDRRRVPVYSRYGNGRFILGTNKRYQFSQESSQELFSVALPPDSAASIFRDKNNPLVLRAMAAASSVTRSRGSAKTEKDADDFIALESKKRKRGDDDDSEHDSSSSDSSSSSSDEDDFGTGDTASALKQQRIELSRRVKDQPDDVDAWLALVGLQGHQRQFLGGEAALPGRPSQDEATGVAQVQLSMLDTALKHVSARPDRERLQLAAMQAHAQTTPTAAKLAQRWDDLARQSPGGVLSWPLWRARLDTEMGCLSTFTVDRLRTFLVDRLRYLQKKVESPDSPPEAYAEMVYVFLRATRFLYDAGFGGLAVAAWQVLLESTFASADNDDDDPLPAEAGLGAFWDSEVPRIGEEGAQGWRHFAARVRRGEDVDVDVNEAALGFGRPRPVLPTVDSTGMVDAVLRAHEDAGDYHHHRQHARDTVPDMGEHRPLYESWGTVERQRAALARLPARIMDDDVDDDGYDDVFRVVVFSDLEDLLFRIPPALMPVLQPLLIDAFLLFCQLPPAFATSPWIDAARHDPFLAVVRWGHDQDQDQDQDESPAHDAARRLPDMTCDGSPIAITPAVLFAQPTWFHYLPDWLQSPAGPADVPVPPSWIATALRQLVRAFGVEALAPYSLAVDAAVHPDGVKKAARALLKQYRTNTGLYNAYALAELARGHVDVARSVLAPAVAAADGEAALELRQTWAWLELDEAGHRNEAVRRLLPASVADSILDTPLSPAELLRARQTLRADMDYGLSLGHVDRAALSAQSFVLLEYLSPSVPPSGQGHLDAALSAATAFSDDMVARGHGHTAAHERLLQWTARVLFFHARQGPYRPADLQAPLRRLITLFPRNGVFLRLFSWIDPASASGLSRLRPDDPVRQILDAVVLTPPHDCPSSRAFAVRHARTSGSAHAALAVLERALTTHADTALRRSAAAWQAYVHGTAAAAMQARRSRGRLDRQMVARAKEVYYQAVQACPGSKAVLLEAFGPDTALVAGPEAAMTPTELRAVFQTLLAKGLRVHVDLTAVLERVQAAADARWADRQG